METIYFSKVRPDVIIPSKKLENAGYDIYANFEHDFLIIEPHETKMIPTGIASACTPDYYFQLFERGSTGTKGLGQRCGVVDSSYRGEWFVPITNHNTKPIIIHKPHVQVKETSDNSLWTRIEYDDTTPTEIILNSLFIIPYSYEKAICQAVLLPVPKVEVEEIDYDSLKNIVSERGIGCLGSSGK